MNDDADSGMIRLQILFADPGSLHMCLYHCVDKVFSSGSHLQNIYMQIMKAERDRSLTRV